MKKKWILFLEILFGVIVIAGLGYFVLAGANKEPVQYAPDDIQDDYQVIAYIPLAKGDLNTHG